LVDLFSQIFNFFIELIFFSAHFFKFILFFFKLICPLLKSSIIELFVFLIKILQFFKLGFQNIISHRLIITTNSARPHRLPVVSGLGTRPHGPSWTLICGLSTGLLLPLCSPGLVREAIVQIDERLIRILPGQSRLLLRGLLGHLLLIAAEVDVRSGDLAKDFLAVTHELGFKAVILFLFEIWFTRAKSFPFFMIGVFRVGPSIIFFFF